MFIFKIGHWIGRVASVYQLSVVGGIGWTRCTLQSLSTSRTAHAAQSSGFRTNNEAEPPGFTKCGKAAESLTPKPRECLFIWTSWAWETIISQQQDVLSSHDTLMKRRSTWLRFQLLTSVKVHLCASGWQLFILPIKTEKENNLKKKTANSEKKNLTFWLVHYSSSFTSQVSAIVYYPNIRHFNGYY